MNHEKHAAVAVVGAGPAGAHLAARLAAAGVRVRLFDHQAPWEKPCGGGITHKAWAKFPILRDAALPRNETTHSLQISPNRRFFVIDEGPPLVLTSRRALGEIMLAAAVRAGADFLPLRVESVGLDNGRIALTTERETFSADFVVGADGVRSIVRRAFLGPLPKWRTLGAVCRFYEGGPADPTMIRVSNYAGYAWAFARHDCLAVGAGAMQRDFPVNDELRRFMDDFFPGRRPLGPAQGALLPYLHNWTAYREPRVGRNWALVGDAAGFVDTLTGEGIGFAVHSADLLADAWLARRPSAYDRAWRRAFGPHLLTGAWLARFVFKPRFVDRLFAAITVSPALRGLFLDYVRHLPPYHRLVPRALRLLPTIRREWCRFLAAGGRLEPRALAPFEAMAEQVDLNLH